MERQGVSKETKKANIRVAILLGVIVILGVISTFFTLGDKIG